MWCLIGAGAALALALALVGPGSSTFLLASLGGSTVFLFGLTRAPATQPRALFGGHLSAALIGIACYQAFGDVFWVYVVAELAAMSLMLFTKTVHPPAGANPILMVHFHAGWSALLNPVFLGVVSLAVIAALWSRLYPGLVHYPLVWLERSPARITWGGWED
jgi:CBS-domain-containing membrane protein